MALYGGSRDISMFRRVNRELMGNIISQEIIYYKYKVGETKTNMYGEAFEGRNFADPVMLFALVEIGGTESPVSDLGVDFSWPLTVRLLRDDLLNHVERQCSNTFFVTSFTLKDEYKQFNTSKL